MTSPEPSDQTRRRSRWRYERSQGLEFDRVAFFTDAVFAIAMTLLIVSIGAPELRGAVNEPDVLWEELRDKAPEFVSFFLAFLLLGRYWMAQHEFFAALGALDRSLMTATLVYLAFVAFLPFPTELVGRYEHNPGSVVLFALCLAMISGMESIVFRVAHRHDLFTVKLAHEAYRVGMIQSTTPVALFLLSIPIAFWSPTVALLSWLLSIPLGIAVDRWAHVDSRTIMAPRDQRPVERDGP